MSMTSAWAVMAPYMVRMDALRELAYLREDASRRGHRGTTPTKAMQAKIKSRKKGRHCR